jgi:hypothetical protein
MIKFIAKHFFQNSKLVRNLERGNKHVKNVKGRLEFGYGQMHTLRLKLPTPLLYFYPPRPYSHSIIEDSSHL